ncbi:bifunctional serine/threonine-protein kinase/ABC transporter substrate-binding protein [Streptomyces sp. NBC_00690]|uniref:bifunctional serine/threonine-protein kinase/ABC transporter substrate-binding protein n=1 Tax=Streptomyces sp. NBC_00690 TaxID=2975808 RepID=UPI002E29E27B|nr:bifunctional serine/threonine-protein kinase/ABC transporter substrate-binding protein [Streptomyces sp. NBC_00690]
MDDLRPGDPARIGGHRLLGRLGAGGMGVVYLGRTDAGALAAIKVILPEHAGDEDFRARFRREAEAARRVDSPWAVSVTDADTEAERPWIATEFVPGPTLSDVVARRGPLPVRSVMALGRLLSRALAAVHGAGLVHRDVKPGNVLLTADGPRLIDFGIARAADTTALTATGLLVGTPGFLAPEQVSGSTAGPEGDVFSLGCLLVYAATGRTPFGGGAVDAVLYRTVHAAPDLDGVDDASLRALLEHCLTKEPGERPSAAGLDTLIPQDMPAGAAAGWLPEDVVRLIADLSIALLALPDIDATVTDERPGPPRPGSTRRQTLLFAAGGAVLLGTGVFGAVRLTREEAAPRGKSGKSWVIGVHADLTGPGAAAGRAQERGVRLAVDRFNSRAGHPFRLAVKVLDDRGGAGRSARVAEEFTRDPEVLAVIGPTGDAAAEAALPAYDEAALPVLTVSALQIAFPARTNGSFFQAASSYAALSVPVVSRILPRTAVKRLGILINRSGGQAAYQAGYTANLIARDLTDATTHPRVVPPGTTDFGPVVADLLAHRGDAVFYAGDAAGAARVAHALAAVSFTGPRMAQHTVMGAEFLERAGAAAEGWEFVAPFTHATAPAAATFAAAHRGRFGAEPAAWSAEAYDAAGLVARALADLVGGGADGTGARATPSGRGGSARPTRPPRKAETVPPTRSALTAAVAATRYEGISRSYTFDEDNQSLVGRHAHLYRVENRRYRYLGPAPEWKG